MWSFRRVALLMSPLLMLSCASTTEPQNDYYNPFRPGGYVELEVQRGLYRIEAKGERALGDPYASVRALWHGRARALCGAGAYQEFAVDETAYGSRNDVFDRLIAVRTGYAACAPLSLEQAQSIVRSKGWPQ